MGATKFSTAKEIQKIAKVPRQEIYSILSDLQEMGLVVRTIGRPLMFKATPIKKGVSILLKQKIRETKKMQQQAEEMMENHNQMIHNHEAQATKQHFVLLPKKGASITKRQEEIDNTKMSLDFISSWKRFPKTIDTFGKNIIMALERNVKIRFILENHKDMHQIQEMVNNFKKYPNYELRNIHNNPQAIIGIFDKKKIIITTSAKVGFAEVPSLWSDNPCLVSVFCEHFEQAWAKAAKNISIDLSIKPTLL